MDTVFKVKILLFILILFISNAVYAQVQTQVDIRYRSNAQFAQNVQVKVEDFIQEVNASYFGNKELTLNRSAFTNSAIRRINDVWENTPFYCPDGSIQLSLIRTVSTSFELRNIPVLVAATDGEPEMSELVININVDGKIEDISFALEYQLYKKVMDNKLPDREYRIRQIIIDFVECYRTAYNRKDINYIEKVFSDDALIIVGRVVEPDLTSEEVKLADPKNVEYVKQSKAEHMVHLKRVFDSNKKILVLFDDIKISISPKNKNVYGVQLLQTWRGDFYADKGYLFLVIDFSVEDRPKIFVRTWQPDIDEDLFDLGSFVL